MGVNFCSIFSFSNTSVQSLFLNSVPLSVNIFLDGPKVQHMWSMLALIMSSARFDYSGRGGAGTVGNPVQVGNTTFMSFIKCQLHIITMLLHPHKLLILLYYLDNICWWRGQCRLIRNASIVCYPLALKLSAKDF